ncbi:MAG TPA: AsmA-like C-terminal region-containing protein [Terracidiphilus sp.]|jgi:hypothetical protein|nr:AsmA-like C-terminal region-containing protein [Terracidiphilus sp.]
MEALNNVDGSGERQEGARSFWRRHRWLVFTAAAAIVALAAISAVLAILAHQVEPYLRARLIEGLEQRFHTRVELDDFHVSVHHGAEARWGIWATGRGLRIWPPHRGGGNYPLQTAVQSIPLIQLREFSFRVPLHYKNAQPLHIPEVQLKGLDILIPPKSERDRESGLQSAMNAPASAEEKQNANPPQGGSSMFSTAVVEKIVCEQANLVLETDKPNKLPLTFAIAHLKLMHLSAGKPMQFEAELTNARPKGKIDTSGSFGPWKTNDPGQSPVSGKYRFQHADLSEFNGIAGILSSNGTYDGTLREMVVDGETMVPDFHLTQFAGKLPLHTEFHARVDGTNGDTYLDQVNAVLGRSQFSTAGKVVQVKPEEGAAQPAPGHLIDLSVDVPHGQMEDFLRLVSRTGTPQLTGVVESKAALHIRPGEGPVYMRLKLDGFFKLADARFMSAKIQDRIVDLSVRGQGKPNALKTTDPNSIRSEMRGNFHLVKGVISLPDLQYGVPGALVQLKGAYSLDGKLQFDGTARMDATVSQMVGGWKGFLLKPADRFFKKDGAGTLMPIKIRGTREHPDISIDFGRMKTTTPERPGTQQQ